MGEVNLKHVRARGKRDPSPLHPRATQARARLRVVLCGDAVAVGLGLGLPLQGKSRRTPAHARSPPRPALPPFFRPLFRTRVQIPIRRGQPATPALPASFRRRSRRPDPIFLC